MICQYLSDHGYAAPSPEWRTWVETFKSWYQGYVKDFHRYWIYNGIDRQERDRAQLGMAKLVCEDMATLLLNDKVRISCDGFDRLEEILNANDFYAMATRLVELSMAMGTGALVEYLDADNQPVIDYITADMIYPLKWHGQRITECAFGSRVVVEKSLGYYIQIHTLENDMYHIHNVWLNEKGVEVDPPEGIETDVATGSPLPLFQFIRPAAVNTVDLASPMGAAIFATAIEQLKGCDIVYDSYVNEFNLGRKRVYVPMSLATIQLQKGGTVEPRFDPKDTVFHVLEQSPDGKQVLTESNMTLRVAEHDQGMQRMIDLVSKKCGLGTGRYRFEGGVVKTAKEVVAENSDLYQSIKRNEKIIESALFDMIRALAFLCGHTGEVAPVIAFDDSIFDDTSATVERNITLVNAGLRSKLDAIMEIDQCDQETAAKKLAAIQKEQSVSQKAVENFFLGGE